MKITEFYKGYSQTEYILEYHDADNFDNLEYDKCKQSYGICFYNGLLVIGFGGKKKTWGPIGGTIEKGETYEETLIREVKEESNMKVLSYKPIGYQKVIDVKENSFIYQLRYACIVEPFGPFISDPAMGVSEIKLINPNEYKKYFDWRQIGDRLIDRARGIMKV